MTGSPTRPAMDTPLFLASSKPAITVPCAGHTKFSSSAPAESVLGGTAGVAGVVADGVAGASGTGSVEESGRDTTPEGATGVTAAVPGAPAGGLTAATVGGVAPGGCTRKTWPTSRMFGLVRLFQACTSRQLCPLSSAIRNSVSPGLTV